MNPDVPETEVTFYLVPTVAYLKMYIKSWQHFGFHFPALFNTIRNCGEIHFPTPLFSLIFLAGGAFKGDGRGEKGLDEKP